MQLVNPKKDLMMKRSIIVAFTIVSSVSAMDSEEQTRQMNTFHLQLQKRRMLVRQFLAMRPHGDCQALQCIATQLGQYDNPNPGSQVQQEHALPHYHLSISPLFIVVMTAVVAGCTQLYHWF